MGYQVGILEAIRDWGLPFVEVPGWQHRGDEVFSPRGHVVHHDAVPGHPATMPAIIQVGREDLAGPLANFWLRADGTVFLVAAGEANHAGEGGWNGLSGNASVWGVEMSNAGYPTDPWPEVQIEAATRLCACTADYSGFPVANVCFHREWTSRKIDPHTLDPGAFRTQVALQEKQEGLTMADITELIEVERAQGRKTRRTIAHQHALDRKQAARLAGDHRAEQDADEEAKAILKAPDTDFD